MTKENKKKCQNKNWEKNVSDKQKNKNKNKK